MSGIALFPCNNTCLLCHSKYITFRPHQVTTVPVVSPDPQPCPDMMAFAYSKQPGIRFQYNWLVQFLILSNINLNQHIFGNPTFVAHELVTRKGVSSIYIISFFMVDKLQSPLLVIFVKDDNCNPCNISCDNSNN